MRAHARTTTTASTRQAITASIQNQRLESLTTCLQAKNCLRLSLRDWVEIARVTLNHDNSAYLQALASSLLRHNTTITIQVIDIIAVTLINAIEPDFSHLAALLTAGFNINTALKSSEVDFHCPLDSDDDNRPNKTLLIEACNLKDESLVRWCLAYGANPNQRDGYGWTALNTALHNGEINIARLLLTADAAVSQANTAPNNKQTPLNLALNNADPSSLLLLLQHQVLTNSTDIRNITRHPHDLSQTHRNCIRNYLQSLNPQQRKRYQQFYNSELQRIVAIPAHLRSAEHDQTLLNCLALGGDIKTTNDHGWNLLHVQARFSHSAASLAYLINNGIDTSQFTPGGLSALDIAMQYNNSRASEFLLAHASTPKPTHAQLTCYLEWLTSSATNPCATLKQLARHGYDINSNATNGNSALLQAIKYSDRALIEHCLGLPIKYHDDESDLDISDCLDAIRPLLNTVEASDYHAVTTKLRIALSQHQNDILQFIPRLELAQGKALLCHIRNNRQHILHQVFNHVGYDEPTLTRVGHFFTSPQSLLKNLYQCYGVEKTRADSAPLMLRARPRTTRPRSNAIIELGELESKSSAPMPH